MVHAAVKISVLGLTLGIAALTFMIAGSVDLVWIPSCTTSGGGSWGPRQYYDGSAPDGWYPVWAGMASEDGTVFFPMCPHSGSRLHGTWKTTVFIGQDFGGEVRVENNVIVEKR